MQALLLLPGDLRKKALDGEEVMSRSGVWDGDKHRQFVQVTDQVLAELEPSYADMEARAALVQFLDKFVNLSLAGTSIVPFGSYAMNIYSRSSDLDLSLQTNCGPRALTRDLKVWYLKRLVACLHQREGAFENIQPVYRAAVPIVKFVDRKSGIQCDVSVDNNDGILKSTVLAALCTIDARLRPLCLLLKRWASSHKINDPSNGGLSSYALVLLAVFHLQTCSPPILPPLSSLIGGLDLSDTVNCVFYVPGRARDLQGFGGRNLESVSELFRTFFMKMLPVKDLWKQGLSASAFQASWVAKWSHYTTCISVEDFADQSQNAARTVKQKEFDDIYQCMERTYSQFQKPISDLASFKKNVFSGRCMPDPRPQVLPSFPNPLHFQANKELPLYQNRRF